MMMEVEWEPRPADPEWEAMMKRVERNQRPHCEDCGAFISFRHAETCGCWRT